MKDRLVGGAEEGNILMLQQQQRRHLFLSPLSLKPKYHHEGEKTLLSDVY
jgi:hypothetical protein